jgi:hypothetical protein
MAFSLAAAIAFSSLRSIPAERSAKGRCEERECRFGQKDR